MVFQGSDFKKKKAKKKKKNQDLNFSIQEKEIAKEIPQYIRKPRKLGLPLRKDQFYLIFSNAQP